jgi:hypothetical protein
MWCSVPVILTITSRRDDGVREVAEKATASLSIVLARLALIVTAGLYGGIHYAEIAQSKMETHPSDGTL